MSQKKPQPQTKEELKGVAKIVKPIIGQQKEKHPLQVLFSGEPAEFPVLKSVGYAPMGPGPSWVSYLITSQGSEILSIEVGEPNLRQIAEDMAKTDFVT